MNKLVSLEVKPKKSYKLGLEPRQWSGSTVSIARSLPFYKSKQSNAKYIHRLRSASNHWEKGVLSHTSAHMFCVASMFIGKGKGILLAEVPENSILCAVCEGKAVGSGLDDRKINGRDVMYKPREVDILEAL